MQQEFQSVQSYVSRYLSNEKKERERQERERNEQERLERERKERERQERERNEQERLERERKERERQERERKEQERLERERKKKRKKRLERERLETDRFLKIVKESLVEVPAGTFMMGALPRDEDAGDNEKPQHEVILTKGMLVSKYACTQGLYEKVMVRIQVSSKVPLDP